MNTLIETAIRPQSWPLTVWVVLLLTFIVQLSRRPQFSPGAPLLAKFGNWPILGAWRYYSDRLHFYQDNQAASKTGNFSFYVGKLQVVALSGHEGRRTFFDSKELHPGPGYAALFAGSPTQADMTADKFGPWFSKTLVHLMKKENFVKNLAQLTADVRTACERLASAPASPADPGWRVFDPFDDLYRVVYRLTMRTVGCREIAEDTVLLEKTLGLFEGLDAMRSTLRFFIPWLPTWGHLKRMYAGIQLYGIFGRIADSRRALMKEGKREDDAFQVLVEDEGVDNLMIMQFVVGSLFAGQINSGLMAAWVPIHLAMEPEWKARVQAEIDEAIAKFRRSPDQSPVDILDSLPLEAWETEFGLIDLCLREAMRVNLIGTPFRTNVSGKDFAVAKTGELIPPGSHVVYLMDDVHMNPEIYPSPSRFDPGRYLEGREEDKKVPSGYVGWGSGRHPCLGMRFAKLEMNLILVYLMAMFEFELSDSEGNPGRHPQPVNRNNVQAVKPETKIHLRYKLRKKE